jgi:hypothetical protein
MKPEGEFPVAIGRTTPKEFLGRWRITGSDVWGSDALDLAGPAHITFVDALLGDFQMIAIEGGLDCRFSGNRVAFSWVGDDDGEASSGRGWAEVLQDGTLRGRMFIHQGDDSAFVAVREVARSPRRLRHRAVSTRRR